MRKHTSAVVAAASVLVVTAACAGADGGEDGDLEVVDVIHVPSTLFSPLYVADARGYFADEGLELSMETVQAGQDAIPLTAAGQADVLVAGLGSGLFSAVNDDLEIKVVGSMGGGGGEEDNSPSALMVAADLVESGEIAEVGDLEGRTVALSGDLGGAGAYQLATILEQGDLTLDDIEALNVDFGDMAGALESGGADAALPPAPFTSAMIEDGTAEQFALPPEGTIASGVLYGEHFLESDQAQPFFDALVRASADLQEDPYDPEILEVLAEATEQDIEVLEESPTYVWYPDLAPAQDQLEAQQEAYREAGLFDFPESVSIEEQVVDTSFAEASDAGAAQD
ncbi:ABC transporter substrate-binding protein [Nocardiopsis nanhaiensis]